MLDKRVIITILMAVFLATFLGYFNNTSSKELEKRFFVYKYHNAQKYPIIIAGDSRIYRGISASAFKETLGLASFNMGFSSALYDKEYLDLVESKLDTNAKTPIIILGITPHSLLYYGYPNGHIKNLQKMKKEEVIDYLYLFSLKTFFSPLRFDTKWQLASSKENNYMQDFNYTQGWAASDYKNRDINHALKPYAQIFMNKQISEKNLKFLMQTIERWSKSGIAVYGFVPPSSAKIEQIERENTTFNDQEIVKDFIQAGGKWISLNGVFQSYDGSHLIKEDAVALSQEIADEIKNKKVDSVFVNSKNYRAHYSLDK